MTIGRSRDCTITLPHVSVSRLHARLTQDSRGWTLSDALFTVTHSTLQLKLCDRIVFIGKGGNLCFCGSCDEALEFFGIDDIVDVYNMISGEPRASPPRAWACSCPPCTTTPTGP